VARRVERAEGQLVGEPEDGVRARAHAQGGAGGDLAGGAARFGHDQRVDRARSAPAAASPVQARARARPAQHGEPPPALRREAAGDRGGPLLHLREGPRDAVGGVAVHRHGRRAAGPSRRGAAQEHDPVGAGLGAPGEQQRHPGAVAGVGEPARHEGGHRVRQQPLDRAVPDQRHGAVAAQAQRARRGRGPGSRWRLPRRTPARASRWPPCRDD
jgi:hypothetical protein